MNLASLPDRRAKHDPKGASVADDDNDLNNNEFLAAVQRAAAALQAHGVSAGAHSRPECHARLPEPP